MKKIGYQLRMYACLYKFEWHVDYNAHTYPHRCIQTYMCSLHGRRKIENIWGGGGGRGRGGGGAGGKVKKKMGGQIPVGI